MAKKIHLKIQFLFVVSKLKRFCHFDTQSLKHHNKCRHNNKPHTKNRMSQLSLIFICNCKNSFVSYYNLSEMQKKREKEKKYMKSDFNHGAGIMGTYIGLKIFSFLHLYLPLNSQNSCYELTKIRSRNTILLMPCSNELFFGG